MDKPVSETCPFRQSMTCHRNCQMYLAANETCAIREIAEQLHDIKTLLKRK